MSFGDISALEVMDKLLKRFCWVSRAFWTRVCIFADDSEKIHQLTNFSAMGSAGYCNVIAHLERKMRSTCSSFRSLYGQDLSPDGQVNYLRNILRL